jgi:hypothetical protein
MRISERPKPTPAQTTNFDMTIRVTTWDYNWDTDNGTPQWRRGKYDECEFARNHEVARMFADLHIDTKSTWQNGPNRCYFIYHKDGPGVKRFGAYLPAVQNQRYDVGGREYRLSTY